MNNISQHNEHFYREAAKYLCTELNPEEKRVFLEQLSADPELKKEMDILQAQWNRIENPHYFASAEVPIEKSWQVIKAQTGANQTGANLEKSTKRPVNLVQSYFRYAAALLLMVGLGTALVFYFNQADNLMALHGSGENNTMVHTLSDGSVVYLGQNSQLSLPPRFEENTRKVRIIEGEVFFDVAHMPDKPFTIETRQASIEVLGTSFNIKTHANGTTEVYVESGSVSVRAKNREKSHTLLHPGELVVIENREIIKHKFVDYYNTAWRKDQMQFVNESLDNIIKVLNQNYPISFLLEDDELRSRRLNLTLQDTNPNIIGELISTSLSINYRLDEQQNIIFAIKP